MRSIKSINGKKVYFKPDKPFYYEIFNEKYLIASAIDSLVISEHLSTPPNFFFPRKKMFFMSLMKDSFGKFFYVDLNNEVIIENQAIGQIEKDYFFIKKIDINQMKIELFNPVMNLWKKYEIKSL
ncbi:hypothetical protein [Ferruginibacter sp.]